MVRESRMLLESGMSIPWELTREGFDDEADHMTLRKKIRRGRPPKKSPEDAATPRDESRTDPCQPTDRGNDPRQQTRGLWPLADDGERDPPAERLDQSHEPTAKTV